MDFLQLNQITGFLEFSKSYHGYDITVIYSYHLQYIPGQPVLSLKIESKCDSYWNSIVLSGNFQAIGGFVDKKHGSAHYVLQYILYAKDTPDENGNWWFLYYDQNLQVWKFSYAETKPKPGDYIFGDIVSEYDSTNRMKGYAYPLTYPKRIFEPIYQVDNCKYYINGKLRH